MSDTVSLTAQKTTMQSIVYGTLTAFSCLFIGGILIALGSATAGYGCTMFMIFPAATGFVTALSVRYWKAVLISLMIPTVLCLVGLVVTGLKGIICVVIASPILLISVLLGAAIGILAKRVVPTETSSSMAILPLLAGVSVFGVGNIEDRLNNGVRTEVVKSSIVIDAARKDVWNAIIDFGEVNGPKPLLMQVGLPIPESCTISGFGVGSK